MEAWVIRILRTSVKTHGYSSFRRATLGYEEEKAGGR
jgi:hypothetical protein